MISFGTDGWRGIIADDFTFENVRIVSQAVCDYVNAEARTAKSKEQRAKSTSLVIGYDTRFLSERFAREAACVAAGNGIKVLITDSFTPTPAVSYAVVDKKTDGAIMFTASHNPYRYNGLKFKAPYGGSASPAITEKIEKMLENNFRTGRKTTSIAYNDAISDGLIEVFNPKPAYLKQLGDLVDTDMLRNYHTGVVVDPMYGAGQGYLSDFLNSTGCNVLEIHNRHDPYFGGLNPEPLQQNLAELINEVTGRQPLGIALDGDADRLGVIDISGNYINSHQIFSLLLKYLFEEKKMTGDIVKTVSTTGMLDLISASYGLNLHETPIGFKYICEHMLTGKILIGGEESGGIGIQGHIPERDGMLTGALLVEMTNFYGKTLSQLWAELESEYGRFCYDRVDMEIDQASLSNILSYFRKYSPTEMGGVDVIRIDNQDGFKFYLADNSWLMIRPSGTEAVVRIYAEAGSPERVSELLSIGRTLINQVF